MGQISLVIPGSGAPDLLSIDAWVALSRAPIFASADDPLALALVERGFTIRTFETDAATPHPTSTMSVGGGLPMAGGGGGHEHGTRSPAIEAAADQIVAAAADGEVCVIEHDERLRRALMRRALDHGLAIEFVVGAPPLGHVVLEVAKTMTRLHGPEGCPWDREQTHRTLAKHVLDEAYELLDAIESGNDADIREELGDILLQVVFHAQLGRDAGTFDLDDVAATLDEKLKRRHPHVFAGVEVSGSDEVVANWDQIKRTEKTGGVFEGVPRALPALQEAQKLQRRAESAGYAALGPSLDDLAGTLGQVCDEETLGALLFELTAYARRSGLDAETALRAASRAYRVDVETKLGPSQA